MLMRSISLAALFMALVGIITPYSLVFVVMFAGVAAALTLQDRPAVSGLAFVINFFNILAHVPGLAFPEAAFEAGTLSIGGPLHWIYLAVQFPIILVGFFMMIRRATPKTVKQKPVPNEEFTIKRQKGGLF